MKTTKKERTRELLMTMRIGKKDQDRPTILDTFDAVMLQEEYEYQVSNLIHGSLTKNQMHSLYRVLQVARAAGQLMEREDAKN